MSSILTSGASKSLVKSGDSGVDRKRRKNPRNQIAADADPARALVKAMAMDIGKEVVAYVEVMYPKAIEATSSTFRLSLRNCIYNEIMAAIEVTDEGQIIARMNTRKKFRREWTAAWRKIREKAPTPMTHRQGRGEAIPMTLEDE